MQIKALILKWLTEFVSLTTPQDLSDMQNSALDCIMFSDHVTKKQVFSLFYLKPNRAKAHLPPNTCPSHRFSVWLQVYIFKHVDVKAAVNTELNDVTLNKFTVFKLVGKQRYINATDKGFSDITIPNESVAKGDFCGGPLWTTGLRGSTEAEGATSVHVNVPTIWTMLDSSSQLSLSELPASLLDLSGEENICGMWSRVAGCFLCSSWYLCFWLITSHIYYWTTKTLKTQWAFGFLVKRETNRRKTLRRDSDRILCCRAKFESFMQKMCRIFSNYSFSNIISCC